MVRERTACAPPATTDSGVDVGDPRAIVVIHDGEISPSVAIEIDQIVDATAIAFGIYLDLEYYWAPSGIEADDKDMIRRGEAVRHRRAQRADGVRWALVMVSRASRERRGGGTPHHRVTDSARC